MKKLTTLFLSLALLLVLCACGAPNASSGNASSGDAYASWGNASSGDAYASWGNASSGDAYASWGDASAGDAAGVLPLSATPASTDEPFFCVTLESSRLYAFPAGGGEGMVLTVTGKGNAARQGGVSGDLLVMIEEEPNPELVRDGNDLIHNLNITVTLALLGGTVEVPTVDGRAKIKIAPGTHAGKVLRLGGKGLPDVNGYGRGDELVVVDITIPSKLNAEEKRLVEELSRQPGFQKADSVKNQNIFERMKSFFR